MLRGIYASASGMLLEGLRTDVVANNLANAQTYGFKRQSASVLAFPEMLIQRINDPTRIGIAKAGPRPAIGYLGTGAAIDEFALEMTPGTFEFTGRGLDLAIDGPAFFAVETPEGGVAYTRDGRMHVDAEGFWANDGGMRLLGTGGPIRVENEAEPFVDAEGRVWIEGAPAAQIALWEFPEPGALERLGDNLLAATKESGDPVLADESQIRREYLERANVNVVKEMVDLIAIQRAYEANQRMATIQDETLGRLINDAASIA